MHTTTETPVRTMPFIAKPKRSSGKVPQLVFWAGILAYLVAVTFQGFDLLDEGFHVTFYQQFFRDPESVQYAFFYWFSGLIGASVLEWFPSAGLWGLRVAGALTIFLTILMTDRMLRPYIGTTVRRISIILLVLLINTEPKDFHYNIISAAMYFGAAWAMFNGLTKDKAWLLGVSGLLLAVNFFTRTPNLLGLGLAVVVIYDWWERKQQFSLLAKKLAIFAAGAILGFAATYMLMSAIGHVEYFTRSLRYLTQMGSTTDKSDGLGGGYGLGKMIYSPVKQYSLSAIGAILVAAISGFLFFLHAMAKRLPAQVQPLLRLAPVGLIAFILWLIMTDRLKIELLIYLYTGVALLGFVFTMLFSRNRQIRLMSMLGMFIVLVHPFGSAPGIVSVVIYSLWLSFPITLHYLYCLKGLDVRLGTVFPSNKLNLSFTVSRTQVRQFGLALALLTAGICIFHLYRYPYFYDYHRRTALTHPIQNPWVKNIYTSEARAKSLNDALGALTTYVKPDDYLLAYDAIPMIHFMTETRPYLNNPSPFFYSNGIFRMEMENARQTRPLPVVIRQKIKMAHEGGSWPEELVVGDYFTEDRNRSKNEFVTEFLSENKYREVWSNEAFSILVPPGK
jgi:hypothetical protein